MTPTPALPDGMGLVDPGDVEPEPIPEPIWQARAPIGDGALFHPAVDPQGRVWVAVAGENRFLIFDLDGNFLDAWGESGSGEGQFNFASQHSPMFGGIAFASDGTYYVSESGNRRVQKFDADREFVLSWGTFGAGDDQFLVPNAIAVDGAGNVYVHDDDTAVHKMFTADGEFVRTFAWGSTPFVAVSDAGNVYAQMWSPNVLNEYAPDGTLVRSIDLHGLAALPRVADLKVDGDGRLWLSSVLEDGPRDIADKVFVLDRDGQLLHRWDGMAVTQFDLDPRGGRLYATFFDQRVVSAYSMAGD